MTTKLGRNPYPKFGEWNIWNNKRKLVHYNHNLDKQSREKQYNIH
jgi:hypothetical protein